MKKINIGILASVDSGKTTLSESMLFVSGAIKNQGKIDNNDSPCGSGHNNDTVCGRFCPK